MPTINFPTGPTLNDEYSFGGKTWKYNGTAWELISTGITSQIRLHANAAYDAANTADQKGTSAGSYANGAFSKANTANTLAQAAFDAANSAAGTFAQASYTHANAAFVTANSAGSYANGAFAAANTADQKATSAGSYANGAFTAANTADQRAVTSGSYANSAYSQANTASSYANGAFVAANTADQRAVTSGTYANAAFAAANTADQKAVSAGVYANAAFTTANTKFASSGGTISGDVVITGNLSVEGNVVTVNVNTLSVEDSIIQLARNNTTDAIDIGFVGQYSNGVSNVNTGLIRHAADDTYYLFKNYSSDPGIVIDVANATIATINTNIIASSILLRNVDPLTQANAAFAAANTADQKAVSAGVYANAAFAAANSGASLYAQAAYGHANAAFVAANTSDQKAVSAGVYANGAFAAANTADQRAVTSGAYANAAYAKANSGINFYGDSGVTAIGLEGSLSVIGANGINVAVTSGTVTVNGGQIYRHANAAFAAANNAVDTWVRDAANSAASYANSAFVKANSAFENAAAASSYANGAFAAANTADQKAVSAGVYANSAFVSANSASSYANGAFTTANGRMLFTYSDTVPGGTPKQGDQWYESDSGILFTYINDGDTSQWVQLGV
jgi:hypothetical protein